MFLCIKPCTLLFEDVALFKIGVTNALVNNVGLKAMSIGLFLGSICEQTDVYTSVFFLKRSKAMKIGFYVG